MPKTSKRHHYLPQFYLKRFTGADGLLCVFDRETKEFRKQQPLNTAHQREFYAITDKQGAKRNDIEQMFSGLESVAANVITRLDARQTTGWKNEDERVSFAIFVAYFYTRTPAFDQEQTAFGEHLYRARMKADHPTPEVTAQWFREFARETGEEVDAETVQGFHKMVRDNAYGVEVPRELNLRLMIDAALHLAGTLLTLNWTFAIAPNDLAFVTSDAPYVIAPPPGETDWRAYGVLTPGATSVIPLSPKTCLLIDNGLHSEDCYRRIQKDAARRINENIAKNSDRFIIGRDQPYLERLVKRTQVDQQRWTSRFVFDTAEIDGEILFHAKRSWPSRE